MTISAKLVLWHSSLHEEVASICIQSNRMLDLFAKVTYFRNIICKSLGKANALPLQSELSLSKLNFMLMKKTFLLLSVVFFQLTAFAQTPEAPTISSFSDYYALNGYGERSHSICPLKTQKAMRSTRRSSSTTSTTTMTLHLTNDWYSKVKADMKDVPYDYNDNLDFFVTGEKHGCSFYVEDYTHVGVQAIYKDGEKVHGLPLFTTTARWLSARPTPTAAESGENSLHRSHGAPSR